MQIMRLAVVAAIAMLTASCPSAAADRENPFLKAKNWGYQLRNLEPEPRKVIANSVYDLVVVDYARGEDRKEIPLTKAEVAEMQKRPDGGKRLVIAYFSIGESEDYRYYWKPEWDTKRPSWMGKENKDWKKNFVVEYWNPEWQKILYGSPDSFIDRIIAAGFDGVYFDRADAYYFFGDSDLARGRMVELINKLAAYAREKNPKFAIMVQNAEELLERKEFVEVIDGVAKESLLYGIKGLGVPNPRSDIQESTALLQKASKSGKAIFVVEYVRDKASIATAAKRVNDELGWALYIGTKGLATLAKSPLTPADPVPDDDDERIGSETKKIVKKKN